MADLQPTDLFLVNRSESTQTVPQADLMAKLEDSDLMLVNRSDQTYTITGLDLKDSIGSPLALAVVLSTYTPISESEITATAVANGGTPPYVFAYQWAKTGVDIAGATQAGYTPVTADVGSTLTCTVTATDDAGDSITVTSDPTAPVVQGIVAPVIDQVTLAEQNPNNAPRFTDQKFDANVICTPASSTPIVYGLKAKVAGDLTITPQTSDITVVETVDWNSKVSNVQNSQEGSDRGIDSLFDGDLTTFVTPPGAGVVCSYDLNDMPVGSYRMYMKVVGPSTVTVDGEVFAAAAEGWRDLATTSPSRVLQAQNGNNAAFVYAIELNGIVLINNLTSLTFADSTGLSNFEPGDVVRQDDATFDGTIYSDYSNFGNNPKNLFDGVLSIDNRTLVTAASDTYYTVLDGVNIPCGAAIRFNYQAVVNPGQMTIRINDTVEVAGGNASSYYGWGPYMPFIGTINKLEWKLTNGQQAGFAGIEVDDTVLVDGTGWNPGGTVGSVSVEDKIIQLSTSTNGWSPGTGNYVLGDQKTIQDATLWLGLEADGTVRRNLLQEEPAYTIYKTVGGLSAPLTLTFPSTFADGDEPDNDLPAGTTLTVYGKVGNDAGAYPTGDTKVGASVTPTIIPGPETVEMYGLRFDKARNAFMTKTQSLPASWTMSVWVKNTLSGSNGYLLSFGGAAGINVFNNGTLQYWTGSGQANLANPGRPSNKVWTHYIVKYDGSNLTGYINGVEGNTVSQSISGSALFIGKNTDGNYLDGYLSDFYFVANAVEPSVFGADVDGKWAPYDPDVAKSNIAAAGGFGDEGFHLMFNPGASGEMYSPYVTANASFASDRQAKNIFDGSLSTSCYGPGVNEVTFEPVTSIPAASVTVYARAGATGQNMTVTLNGNPSTAVTITNTDGSKPDEFVIPMSGETDLQSVFMESSAGAIGYGIEVNGSFLIDHSSIGVDDSGNNNSFTSENFSVGDASRIWSLGVTVNSGNGPNTSVYDGAGGAFVGSSSTARSGLYAENGDWQYNFDPPLPISGSCVLGTSVNTGCSIAINGQTIVAKASGNQSGAEYFGADNPNLVSGGTIGNSLSSIRFTANGGSNGCALYFVQIDGNLLIDANIQDTVKDTPMLDYSVLTSGANGNLEATANDTSLTYLGKAGTLYYYEEDGEGKTHEGGTTFSSSNGKTYNFGQQGFRFQYNNDQPWSQVGALTPPGAFTGGNYAYTNVFNGDLTNYWLPTSNGSSPGGRETYTFDTPIAATEVQILGARSTAASNFQINGSNTAFPPDNKERWFDVSSLLTDGKLISISAEYVSGSSSQLTAVKVDGKILLDAVNGSYTWSNFWAGDVVGPENSFDGDLDTKTEISGSNKTITWTPSTPVSAASGIRIRASKYTGGNDNNLMEVNGSPVGITATSPEWYDVPGNTLTSIAMKDIGSNQGWIHAVEVDGLLLVDSNKAGIAGAVDNELHQTWTEWNNVVTLYADNPADVAKFEAIKADVDAYPDNVTSHRAGLISRLNAGSLTTADVAEITEDINSVS